MASRRLVRLVCIVVVFGVGGVVDGGLLVDFEDLSLSAESYWNGSDGSGGFVSGGAWFGNNYDSMYDSWDGFAYSNITDTATGGMASQYNAIAGGGQGSSEIYAVSWVGWAGLPTMTLDAAGMIEGLYVTNDNYAYYSMLNGDAFAKKFGGSSGDDPDWFMLTVTGKDGSGISTGAVDFYLADYRFADNGLDYILDTWEFVDLTPLGFVKSVEFALSSSDTGEWGMNTPAYFAMDTVAPEPSTVVLLGLGGLLLRGRRFAKR